jgi:hypothetical protein
MMKLTIYVEPHDPRVNAQLHELQNEKNELEQDLSAISSQRFEEKVEWFIDVLAPKLAKLLGADFVVAPVEPSEERAAS